MIGIHARAAAVILAIVLYAGSALAWTEPNSFEGIPWGASLKEAIAIATARGDPIDCDLATSCKGSVNIGPVRAKFRYDFTDDRLSRVFLGFDRKDRALLKQAFIDRYGPPMKDRTTDSMQVTEWRTQMLLISILDDVAILWLDRSLDRQRPCRESSCLVNAEPARPLGIVHQAMLAPGE